MTKHELEKVLPDFEIVEFFDDTRKLLKNPEFEGQEMLIGSGSIVTELKLVSKTDKDKIFNCEVAIRGEIDIVDEVTGDHYKDGDQDSFPEELVNIIKQEKIWDFDPEVGDNTRFHCWANNWYNLFIGDKDWNPLAEAVLDTPWKPDDNLVSILSTLEHDLEVKVVWDMYKPEQRSVHVYNIKWDIDEEIGVFDTTQDSNITILNNEMYIPISEFPADIENCNIDDWISDYISDESGFCHYGFSTDYDENEGCIQEIIDLVHKFNYPLKSKIETMPPWQIAKTFNEIIELEEFEVKYDPDNELPYSLIDTTGTNLGDIESERFPDLGSILDRLDTYHRDYIWDAYSWNEADDKVIQESLYANFLQFCNWDKLEQVSEQPLMFKVNLKIEDNPAPKRDISKNAQVADKVADKDINKKK